MRIIMASCPAYSVYINTYIYMCWLGYMPWLCAMSHETGSALGCLIVVADVAKSGQ